VHVSRHDWYSSVGDAGDVVLDERSETDRQTDSELLVESYRARARDSNQWQTDEVDGCCEEGGRRLRPVVSDGNAHVRQRRVVFKRVADVSRHVDDVLDVVSSQTGQVTRCGRVTQVQVAQHLHTDTDTHQPARSHTTYIVYHSTQTPGYHFRYKFTKR